ncbi:flagellar basal body-associated FliL family protein [Azospirillum halopraeferens]|uniref:flagellar basal body-associated FliL family protein n=1 Tax=Azospirillum halopraeferens TaxID=34010 RepID=UPI0004230FF6|nr:flagellar basal body-associated FliL family protein [Azospirillum halopraeferens]
MNAFVLFAVAAGVAFAAGYGAGRAELAMAASAPAAGVAADPADSSGPHYVDAGQFVVPVLVQGQTAAFILTQMTLETANGDDAALVRRRLPHVRSAVLETLFDLARNGAFDGPAVEPAAAAAALRTGVNARFPAEPVRTVLIDRLLRQDNSRR